jgi:hypothetical protein
MSLKSGRLSASPQLCRIVQRLDEVHGQYHAAYPAVIAWIAITLSPPSPLLTPYKNPSLTHPPYSRLPLIRSLRRHCLDSLLAGRPQRRHQARRRHLRLHAQEQRQGRVVAPRPQGDGDRRQRACARGQEAGRHAHPGRQGFRAAGRGQGECTEAVHEREAQGQGRCHEGFQDGECA